MLTNFVYHLLLLRGATPVDECEILCGELHGDPDEDNGEDLSSRYKRKLDGWLDNVPFASQLLTRVEPTDATFMFGSIDFSRCPALEDLKMSTCRIHADRISSQSLTYLSIADYCFHGETWTRFSTPRLISLELDVGSGRAPFLENMPLLVAANVTLDDWCNDTCSHNVCGHKGYSWQRSHSSRDSCYCINDDGSGVYLENLTSCDSFYDRNDGSSVLLEGLSDATDLELTSDLRVFIFRKNYKSGTTSFNNLKTLLLNEWCMAVDFGPLVFFLHCSPVLEKHALQLGHCETRHPVVKTDESCSPTEQLFSVSKQLMIVEIKCVKENKLVEKLLLLLTTNGVPRKQIHIEENFSPPD
ncbi:hypothetical protein BAE44_0020946, partial [Dichanthelium oligosanthes]